MTAYDAFAPVYDAWSASMTEDVAFYADLAREADVRTFELDEPAAVDCPFRSLLHLPTREFAWVARKP